MGLNYIDDCLERAQKATPGPWQQFSNTVEGTSCNYIESDRGWVTTVFTGFKNADFIAHARTDVEELAKRLKKAIEACRTEAKLEAATAGPFGPFGEKWNKLADELEAPLEAK